MNDVDSDKCLVCSVSVSWVSGGFLEEVASACIETTAINARAVD
jgi:hypothetical protein